MSASQVLHFFRLYFYYIYTYILLLLLGFCLLSHHHTSEVFTGQRKSGFEIMLRKRTRSHQKDQPMGHLVSDVSDSEYHSDALGQKHKTNSFFNVPGVFVGLSPKGPEYESIRSPTSPLDFRVFSTIGNPFRSPKSSHEKSWGCSKVGLSIIDSLDDETKSGKVLWSSDSKNILFGAQMGIKIPNVRSRFNSFEAPKSLPNNHAIFPSKQIVKLSNLHKGNSDVQFEIGEAPLEAESFGKIRPCSLDSGHSGPRLSNLRTNLSSGKFCLENGTSSVSLPYSFITGCPNLISSSGKKLTPIPVSNVTHDGFIGSLSASEIELSEDYTCVRTHGPNPKTTHIYGDCILECHNNEFTDSSKNEDQEITLSPHVNGSAIPISYPSTDFLSFCYSCKKKLEGEDIYMYRGEKAFCSMNCRSQEILLEEALEKTKNVSSENSLESNNCEELFETGMFMAT